MSLFEKIKKIFKPASQPHSIDALPFCAIDAFTLSCGDCFTQNFQFDGTQLFSWNEVTDSIYTDKDNLPHFLSEKNAVSLNTQDIQTLRPLLDKISTFILNPDQHMLLTNTRRRDSPIFSCTYVHIDILFDNGKIIRVSPRRAFDEYIDHELFLDVFNFVSTLCPPPEIPSCFKENTVRSQEVPDSPSEEIPSIAKTISCPFCHSQTYAHAKFCNICGQQLTEENISDTIDILYKSGDTLLFCDTCGKSNLVYSKYCMYCGHSL